MNHSQNVTNFLWSKKKVSTKTLIHKLSSRNNLALDNFFLKCGGMILLNFNFEDVYSQYAKRDLNKKVMFQNKVYNKINGH